MGIRSAMSEEARQSNEVDISNRVPGVDVEVARGLAVTDSKIELILGGPFVRESRAGVGDGRGD